MWILVALQAGPRRVARLLDDVRSLDGPIGHGTLFAAVSRLERLDLVEPDPDVCSEETYRVA